MVHMNILKMLPEIAFSEKDILYFIGDILDCGTQTFELFLQHYLESDVRMLVLYGGFVGAEVIRDIEKCLKNIRKRIMIICRRCRCTKRKKAGLLGVGRHEGILCLESMK